jgi:hypothetical protein
MPLPDSELQHRIQRIERGLDQVGSLLVPVEISDGVKKAITLCNIDPEMALGRSRKVLDFIIGDLYKRQLGKSAGTQPLENLIQQLAKSGKLPGTMVAYANSVRELGNVGVHGHSVKVCEEDVVSSLENPMRLVAWYCDQVRPTAEAPATESEPPSRQQPAQDQKPPAQEQSVTAKPPDTPPQPEDSQAPPSDTKSPSQWLEDRADDMAKSARKQPLEGGAAIPYLEAAIRDYSDLLAKADQLWSPTANYKVTGIPEPLTLSKQQWKDELEFKRADAHVILGLAKVHAPQHGAQSARADFDAAITALERLDAARSSSDPTLLDVALLLGVRGDLQSAYYQRANCPNDMAVQLQDAAEYIRRWDVVYGKTDVGELVDNGQLELVRLMLYKRAYIRLQISDHLGAVADCERVVKSLEAARAARPSDTRLPEELKKARQALAETKAKAGQGGLGSAFANLFKRK